MSDDNTPCTSNGIQLRPKGNKKPTKLKKQIQSLRSQKLDSESSSSKTNPIYHPESISSLPIDSFELKVIQLLKKLKIFQDRKHHENPVKARMRKRLIYGMREIQRDVEADLIKIVLVAGDIEHFEEPNLLDVNLRNLISTCNAKQIPLIQVSTKKKFAKVLSKSGLVSAIGILDYSGAETLVNEVLETHAGPKEKEASIVAEES